MKNLPETLHQTGAQLTHRARLPSVKPGLLVASPGEKRFRDAVRVKLAAGTGYAGCFCLCCGLRVFGLLE